MFNFAPQEPETMRDIRVGMAGAAEPDHRSLRYRLWRFAKRFGSPAAKFSFKTSMAIVLLSILSFAPLSSDIFHVWRGLWALITVC